jgi:hypothetical protein
MVQQQRCTAVISLLRSSCKAASMRMLIGTFACITSRRQRQAVVSSCLATTSGMSVCLLCTLPCPRSTDTSSSISQPQCCNNPESGVDQQQLVTVHPQCAMTTQTTSDCATAAAEEPRAPAWQHAPVSVGCQQHQQQQNRSSSNQPCTMSSTHCRWHQAQVSTAHMALHHAFGVTLQDISPAGVCCLLLVSEFVRSFFPSEARGAPVQHGLTLILHSMQLSCTVLATRCAPAVEHSLPLCHEGHGCQPLLSTVR